MDEPFSALDPLIRRQLQDEFMQLASVMNRTTVFITHDLDEAVRIGHQIAIMQPPEAYEREHDPLPGDLPSFDHDVNLDVLMKAAVDSDAPMIVVDDARRRIGVVTRSHLLNAVIEGMETS